jgi:hypothetical protein
MATAHLIHGFLGGWHAYTAMIRQSSITRDFTEGFVSRSERSSGACAVEAVDAEPP